jgi:pimeloyl-ACP methyl ester carboxylesterase
MPDHQTIDLPEGSIRYRDLGPRDAEPIVFVHGLLVDSRLWDGVARRLSGEFRCVLPDWPMGSHELPMQPGADLSPTGQADLVAAAMGELDLGRATVVGNDSGGAISQILATRHPERIERLVLTNCDMFDRFPPFPFTLMSPVAKLPGGMRLLQAPFRVRRIAGFTYGMLAAKEIPPELVESWLAPAAADDRVAADTRKLIVSADRSQTLEAAERLRGFDRPALFTWGLDDRFFPLSYAKRMAGQMKRARVVEIEDAKTFIPLDQPDRVAQEIAAFMREPNAVGAAA